MCKAYDRNKDVSRGWLWHSTNPKRTGCTVRSGSLLRHRTTVRSACALGSLMMRSRSAAGHVYTANWIKRYNNPSGPEGYSITTVQRWHVSTTDSLCLEQCSARTVIRSCGRQPSKRSAQQLLGRLYDMSTSLELDALKEVRLPCISRHSHTGILR